MTSDKLKLTQWEKGFIGCLANTVHGHGINTSEIENWRVIGSPSGSDCLAAGMSNYDAEAMDKLEAWSK